MLKLQFGHTSYTVNYANCDQQPIKGRSFIFGGVIVVISLRTNTNATRSKIQNGRLMILVTWADDLSNMGHSSPHGITEKNGIKCASYTGYTRQVCHCSSKKKRYQMCKLYGLYETSLPPLQREKTKEMEYQQVTASTATCASPCSLIDSSAATPTNSRDEGQQQDGEVRPRTHKLIRQSQPHLCNHAMFRPPSCPCAGQATSRPPPRVLPGPS